MADTYIFKNNPALNDIDWDNVPLEDPENAHWLQTMRWGYPKDPKEFIEAIGLYDFPRAKQRELIDRLVAGPRGPHMPKPIRDYLTSLGLID